MSHIETLQAIIDDYHAGAARFKEAEQAFTGLRAELDVLTNLVHDQSMAVLRALEQAIDLMKLIREEREPDDGDNWWRGGGDDSDDDT